MRHETSKLQLGIITGGVATRNEAGQVILSFALGRLLEAIRKDFPLAKVCLPLLPKARDVMNHVLQFPDESIVALPPLGTTVDSQKYYFQTRKVVQLFAKDSDLLLVRLPFQIPRCLLGLKKPKVLHVVSNPVAVVKVSSDYRGAKALAARIFARYLQRTMKTLSKEPLTRTVTNGQEMWDKLNCKEGRVVVSSSMFADEMKPRTNFDLQTPPRLLFVGYLRPEKGISTMLKAFTIVRKKREVKLTIVGGSDRPSGAETLIRESIANNPFSGDIIVSGSLDFGEKLFEMYRSHDIFLSPSLSEGTPRTLVEARSFGCSVIATNVGGVPSSVSDGVDGLLVKAGDANAMAAVVEKLLDDETLRLRLIDEGLKRSRNFTVENFAANIIEELRIVAEGAKIQTR